MLVMRTRQVWDEKKAYERGIRSIIHGQSLNSLLFSRGKKIGVINPSVAHYSSDCSLFVFILALSSFSFSSCSFLVGRTTSIHTARWPSPLMYTR